MLKSYYCLLYTSHPQEPESGFGRLVSDVPVRKVGEGQPHWLPLPSKEMNRLKYYLSYDHVGSHGPVQMQVIPYDPSNGVRVVGNNTFLYHGSLIVSGLFDTIKEALSDLGTYSKPTSCLLYTSRLCRLPCTCNRGPGLGG